MLLMVLFLSFNASAGGLDGFLKFAERGGSMTSVNAPAIIEDQKSGYYTGGSIISRGPRPQVLQQIQIWPIPLIQNYLAQLFFKNILRIS